MRNGVTLKVHRYLQDTGCCAVAAAASVANFYDKGIDYETVKRIALPDGDGMYTPDIARLMNRLGFHNVSVVSANIEHFDFKWQGISRPKMLDEMRRSARYHPDDEAKEIAHAYVKFLADPQYRNELIIDTRFGDYIREHLDAGNPVLASFNWNVFFNYPKWNDRGEVDPLRGFSEEHEVVIYGYDEKNVMILDSHHELYKGRLKKFASGRYTMTWEMLMTVMGFGDLILAGRFVPNVSELAL